MSFFHRLAHLARNLARKKTVEAELAEEVNAYVELLTETKVTAGESVDAARRAALLESGGVEQLKAEIRGERLGSGIETLATDLRHAFRLLVKRPAFTLTVVAVLALGIGANTAIFSIINSVLLRSLPFDQPQRLVGLWETFTQREGRKNVVSPGNFLDWRKQSRSFDQMAAVWDLRLSLTGKGEPIEVSAQRVTADFFPALGIQPLIGRWPLAEEDRPGGNLVAILGFKLWQERFGADRGVIGQMVTIAGRPYTVIGVMPPDFHFMNDQVELWTPLALDPSENYRKSGRFLQAVARLKAGVSQEQAQTEMRTIAQQLETQYPDYNKGWGVLVLPLHEQVVGDVRPTLVVLFGAVGFVLLIACANVANLTLARAASRQKEFALRAALGAGRGRLVRQVLTESLVLALIGGVAGVFLASWGLHVVVALAPENLPRLNEIRIDRPVLAFTFAMSILTGFVFGLLPALQASRADLNEALKDSSRGTTATAGRRWRNLFVVAELSLALILLAGAGLMMRSFFELHQVSPGFSTDHVLALRVQLPGAKYKEKRQRADFFHQAEERIAGLPGVKAVGAINFLPLTGLASSTSFNIEGRPEAPPGEAPGTEIRIISGDYFGAMAIPLLKGRTFNERDDAKSHVAIINQTMARRFFPKENPIGKHLIVNWEPKVSDEIIGIVADTKETALERDPNPAVYWPHSREPYQFMNFVVRTEMEPMQLAPAVQKEIRAIDADQPIGEVRALREIVARSIARPRFNMLLLGVFAGVALILASVGLYGVISYSALQRTHEIGIRMALGASRADILRLVIGNGMRLAFIGIGIGLVGAIALTRLMQSLLFGIRPTDTLTFVAVSTLLMLVALAATYMPARRATRTNPTVALRFE